MAPPPPLLLLVHDLEQGVCHRPATTVYLTRLVVVRRRTRMAVSVSWTRQTAAEHRFTGVRCTRGRVSSATTTRHCFGTS